MIEHILPYTAALAHHPEAHSQIVHEINVQMRWLRDDTLALTYTLTGDCARLRIPPSRPSAKIAGLWQHTCFEAFVSLPGDSVYQEFNFSPSGEWSVYHFRGYRNRLPVEEDDPAPQILVQRTKKSLALEARIRLSQLLIIQPLLLALSAVIEDDAGTLSYWALKHPPGKPDFHHPEAFGLKIAPLYKPPRERENP